MPRATIHWAWVILAVCLADLFVHSSVRLGYSVVLPEMIGELDLSRVAGGTIFNAYLLTYVILTPLIGYLTDRLGARLVITCCGVALGCGVLLMGSAQSLVGASAAFALAGLGSTGMWTPVLTVVQRWFAPSRRGMALGILSTGYGLGLATVGLAFPWIVSGFSWRYTWYFLGAAALVMVLVNGLFLRSSPEALGGRPWGQKSPPQASSPAGPQTLPAGAMGRVFRDRVFWIIGLSYFCISYGLFGMTTYMVDYATNQLGLPLAQASLLATIHGLAQIAGVLTLLPLSDYLGRRNTILISNAGITAALGGIILWGGSWPALCVLVGIMAVFYGATFPIYGACAGDYFPKQVMGTVIGVWTPFYGGGAIVVNWVSGILRDTSGSYEQSFVINAAVAAVGLGLMALVPSKKVSPS